MMHIQQSMTTRQFLSNFPYSSLSVADYNNSSFYTEFCLRNMEWDIFNCVFLCSIWLTTKINKCEYVCVYGCMIDF